MDALLAIASGQYAILTWPQAREHGLTKCDMRRMVRRGEWLHPHLQVYVVRGLMPQTHSPQRLRCLAMAAVYHTYGYGQTKDDYVQLQKYLETEDPADIPSGYSAPFYKADREAEYREAHAYFTEIVERAKRDGTWNGEA